MSRSTIRNLFLGGVLAAFTWGCRDDTQATTAGVTPQIEPPLAAAGTPANGPGLCMGYDAAGAKALDAQWVDGNNSTPFSFNCTANDVRISG